MKPLINVLKKAGKETKVYKTSYGTRVLVLPYGGRVLGLYAAESDENFYWTHDALASAETARKFYGGDQWQNSGGDRTWLAPELDLFFPNYPKLDVYFQQRSLDPGRYRVVRTDDGFKLVSHMRIRHARSRTDLSVRITKSLGPAPNPLRYERDLNRKGLEFAGYTQYTSLELIGNAKHANAHIGLWNLVQMPHGGDLLIPTYSRHQPRHVFSTVGTIPPEDIIVSDHLIRYRMRQKGEHKISIRAVPVCGRVGYAYQAGRKWALIVRNFVVNPSGEYADVPYNEPDNLGFAVQACNVNSGLGQFNELEYHIPAIGHGTGRVRCDDAAQVWAFRGPQDSVEKTARLLLAGNDFKLTQYR
jgi:hypothetical protein